MRHILLALILVSPLALAEGPNIDKLNGAIRTESGKAYGDLETVNGAISVRADVEAEEVSTVNGSISIDERARVRSAEAVNGSISIERDASVEFGVESVNGGISLRQGARGGGSVETVNGSLKLRGAEVQGDLSNVNGSITVDEGSFVHGGITVKKSKGWNFWGDSNSKPPRVTIGANSVVKGTLMFEREVELEVHPTAKIGPLKGVTPIRIDAQTVEK